MTSRGRCGGQPHSFLPLVMEGQEGDHSAEESRCEEVGWCVRDGPYSLNRNKTEHVRRRYSGCWRDMKTPFAIFLSFRRDHKRRERALSALPSSLQVCRNLTGRLQSCSRMAQPTLVETMPDPTFLVHGFMDAREWIHGWHVSKSRRAERWRLSPLK